jgi:hypothetical protein
VRRGAYVQVVAGCGQFELLEEDAVHLMGVMLAGVQDEVVQGSTLALPDDGSHLDDLGPGAQDNSNGHR